MTITGIFAGLAIVLSLPGLSIQIPLGGGATSNYNFAFIFFVLPGVLFGFYYGFAAGLSIGLIKTFMIDGGGYPLWLITYLFDGIIGSIIFYLYRLIKHKKKVYRILSAVFILGVLFAISIIAVGIKGLPYYFYFIIPSIYFLLTLGIILVVLLKNDDTLLDIILIVLLIFFIRGIVDSYFLNTT
jgi:LytS/YehU family sensor histidine kinase